MYLLRSNILFPLGIIFAAGSITLFLSFPYLTLKTIRDHGVTIRYPSKLSYQIIPSTAKNYTNYQFSLGTKNLNSTITVSIPVASTSWLDNPTIRDFFGLSKNTQITQSTIGGHLGQKAQQRMLPTSGDSFVPTTNFYELYPSSISSSPLTLKYVKVDGAQSLDEEFRIIKRYLEWSTVSVSNQNAGVFDPSKNINTTDLRARGPAVVPTGKTVAYDLSFSHPELSGLKRYCLHDGACLRYTARFLPCPDPGDGGIIYFMDSAETCLGLNDAPAFIIETIPGGPNKLTGISAYDRILTDEVLLADQNWSDEIVGQVSGRMISCFDSKFDRVCKITLADGRAYALDGRWYHNTDVYNTETAKTKLTFDAMVRSMMEE